MAEQQLEMALKKIENLQKKKNVASTIVVSLLLFLLGVSWAITLFVCVFYSMDVDCVGTTK